MEPSEFDELLAGLRRWDEQSVRKFVALVEPKLRQIIRGRLDGGGLNRVADTDDVCQSVFLRFLNHANAGDFTLESFEQLQKLLTTMAVNRVRDLARKGGAAAQGRTTGGLRAGGGALEPSDHASTPSQHVALGEILRELRRRLSTKGQKIHKRRAEGRSWAEIAQELHEPPQAVRVRFAREIQQIARELGMDDME